MVEAGRHPALPALAPRLDALLPLCLLAGQPGALCVCVAELLACVACCCHCWLGTDAATAQLGALLPLEVPSWVPCAHPTHVPQLLSASCPPAPCMQPPSCCWALASAAKRT